MAEQVFGLVDPEDVRWVFLSHDDGDHTGALHDVLDLCPNATLVLNFSDRQARPGEGVALAPDDLARKPTEWFDAGDRGCA